MFELLLQADKALSKGLLDQAERTYWQLVELDPTNSIAVAGLARISLQRGDERLARTFADRALSIDPASTAALLVVQALDKGAAEPASAGPRASDLPLKGAERLEALSRRRAASSAGEEGGKTARPDGAAKSSTRPKTADRSGAATGAATPAAATSPGRQPRRGSRPDEFEPMPSEPLPHRRREGRLASAAAAAAAAAREPHARHEPHRAMPSGRHLFGPGVLKARPSDPFAEAEMAAAVAAVDALDDTPEALAPGPAPASAAPAGDVATASERDFEDMLEAVDATQAQDSVDLRLALISGAADSGTDREALAAPPDGPHPGSAEEAAGAEAAEAEASAEALREVSDAPAASSTEASAAQPSEAQAEAQAFREAMATVMADDALPDEAEGPARVAGGEIRVEAIPADAGATSSPGEPVALASHEPPEAEASAPATPDAEAAPRKKGLFRRFRGN